MARVLALLLIVVLLIGALGFYRGWFVAESNNSPNQSSVNVTVDKSAIKQDETLVGEKARDAGETIKDKISPATAPTP